MCSFIPKCQLRPLRVCFISGSRVALAFLVELGAAMMVASTMVPERSNNRRSSSSPVIELKIAWVQPMLLQQVAKAQNRGLVRHHLVAQLDACKATHRLAVVDRVFRLRLRQVEPLLQEVNPQHLLQSQRLATLSGFGVVRLDQPDQPRPRNHPIHLAQEPLAPSHFALPIPRHRCERPLIPHPHTSTPADPTNGLYQNRNTCAEIP